MIDFTFENQGTNTYLVYKISENDAVDSMSLGMLTNNKIPGLASALFTQNDATKYIYYNVSAHVSVKQFFSGPVNKKRLIGVFNGIVNAMMSAEDYMIDVNTIIMDLDYIFADVSTCETVLICLPVLDTKMPTVDLGMFFKNIMFSTQFDQTENCDHVAKIMNYLNSTPVFSLADFKNLLNSIGTDTNIQVTANRQPQTENPVAKVNQQTIQPSVQTQPQKQETVKPQVQPIAKPVQTPTYVPPVQEKPVPVQPSQTAQEVTNEKKISVFGLLMHYNKENAELYKKQKAEKKGGTPAVPTPAKVSNKTAVPNPGFAVPGQNSSVNFAIPGQPTPSLAPISQKAPIAQPASQVAVHSNEPKQETPVQQPAYVPRQVPQGQAMNFGETTVLGGSAIGETTVLTAAQNPNKIVAPHLVRRKNNEKISLNKPVFRVGKERSYVDYFIGDNTAISRSHANFITRDGSYFVVDTNSTNHTFVNGTMIQSNVETAISDGDTIRLANEDFEFKLY